MKTLTLVLPLLATIASAHAKPTCGRVNAVAVSSRDHSLSIDFSGQSPTDPRSLTVGTDEAPVALPLALRALRQPEEPGPLFCFDTQKGEYSLQFERRSWNR